MTLMSTACACEKPTSVISPKSKMQIFALRRTEQIARMPAYSYKLPEIWQTPYLTGHQANEPIHHDAKLAAVEN